MLHLFLDETITEDDATPRRRRRASLAVQPTPTTQLPSPTAASPSRRNKRRLSLFNGPGPATSPLSRLRDCWAAPETYNGLEMEAGTGRDQQAGLRPEAKSRKKSFAQQCLEAALPAIDGEKTPLASPQEDTTRRLLFLLFIFVR